jgi:16S rRNA (cytosine1402-N4)-methyltransferase
MEFVHKSILLEECVNWIVTNPDGIYVDGTMGGAGHTHAIADKLSEKGTIIGIDQDDDAIKTGLARLSDCKCHVEVVKSNFENFDQVLDKLNIEKIDGMLLDLGVSSYQLDNAQRGFSYMQDGPLDMRMDKSSSFDAKKVVNTYSQEKLSEIIYKYGEERWSKRIAEFIVEERKNAPIETTSELVTIIKKAIPKGARQGGPHPAKRTFQAIRIEVNNELGVLEEVLDKVVTRLNSKGRVGIITFHSLEDRIVKQKLAQDAKGCICPPHIPICVCGKKPTIKKPINKKPSKEEIELNPRARSARLRGAEKL